MISNGPETTLLRQEDYQTPSSPKAFDPLLLDQPIRLNGKPKRVFYKTAKGKVRSFGLNESNQIHDVLLLAFGYGIYSSDITNLEKRTQEQYSSSVGQFFDWINEYKYHSCSKNKYRCLKDYESFKMNQRGVKTSPIGILKVVLKSGLDAPLISPQDRKYIEQLLTLSIPVKTNKKESSTLSDWFSISWLQHHLGSTNYLKLESPSRIFSSFRVTIGSTLLYLLDIRDNWHLHPDIEFESNYKNWCYDWNRLLIGKIGQFDNNGEATDELTKVLLQDLIKPSCHENVKNQIKH
ncbi:hypothetical protein, partial [Oleiphilus sp. HI0061]|uniref:hypothetical protein n=1 Tax=Oleiphilus sp. HI0061 TaxID=1822239 RepID=UPI000AB0075B